MPSTHTGSRARERVPGGPSDREWQVLTSVNTSKRSLATPGVAAGLCGSLCASGEL